MPSDAQSRARELISDHRGTTFLVHALGVVDSVIVLKILSIIGLLAAVIFSSGEARFPANSIELLPEASVNTNSGVDGDDMLFDDSGVLPVVTGNLKSSNPLHRAAAYWVARAMQVVPTLQNNIGALTTLLASLLVMLLIQNLIDQYRRGLMAKLATQAAATLRRQIHRQMYRLGQSSLPTEGTGPVINLVTREVNDVRDGLYDELDRNWRSPALAAGLVIYALALSPALAIFLGSLGILTWFIARSARKSAAEAADSAIRDAAINLAMLHEDIGMLRTVRVFAMEKVDLHRFDEHVERFRVAEVARFKSERGINPTTALVYAVAASLALGVLGFSVLKTKQIAPSSGVLLVSVIGALIPPSLGWWKTRNAARQAARSAEAVFEFLGRTPELHQQGGALLLEPLHDKLRFKNVSLKSRSGEMLLSGVNVEIPAGSRTAIMSLNEDSKHALICLIPRLIDPTTGSITIDGRDLREVTLESIRAQVATVLQADLCFTDSVAMNIGLGDPAHGMGRIIEAAKIAHAHNFIQDLPDGYDTVIGPVGHYLKPDEQYRIALARAYLHDPSIMIIEEPELVLDEDTKTLIDDSLARLSVNRTMIILPHRLSTIRSCSQIILLHHAKVETIGTPRQLESESKLFRHMQYLEFNPYAASEADQTHA